MERAHIKCCAEFAFSFRAHGTNAQFTNFVTARLAGPINVPIDFTFDIHLAERSILFHVIDGAIAAPAKRVDAGINDQSCSAPHFIDQPTEVCIRIVLEETHLDAQAFGIETPAFNKCGEVHVAAELRLIGQLLRNGDLQVMTGHGFVQ